MKILWGISALFSIIGFIEGVVMVSGANSAPQQAAGAAMGLAFSVIPYCFCRALQQMNPREVVVKNDSGK
ncbi:hypothetical protein [Lonsdalea britannica]|uniref:hypothetical protein n=1 Tax=Lonsdalea britannica TaxID=1082704 RepID=UPI000A1E75AA|nr:hypothetical protein [Lonsdalea britannica]